MEVGFPLFAEREGIQMLVCVCDRERPFSAEQTLLARSGFAFFCVFRTASFAPKTIVLTLSRPEETDTWTSLEQSVFLQPYLLYALYDHVRYMWRRLPPTSCIPGGDFLVVIFADLRLLIPLCDRLALV